MTEAAQLLEALDEAIDSLKAVNVRHPRRNDEERLPWPTWLRTAIIERDGRHCRWCGQWSAQLELDHILPRSAFPKYKLALADRTDNIQALCLECNRKKSNYRAPHARRIGVAANCVNCCPPAEWADAGHRITVWCATCRAEGHVSDEKMIA